MSIWMAVLLLCVVLAWYILSFLIYSAFATKIDGKQTYWQELCERWAIKSHHRTSIAWTLIFFAPVISLLVLFIYLTNVVKSVFWKLDAQLGNR